MEKECSPSCLKVAGFMSLAPVHYQKTSWQFLSPVGPAWVFVWWFVWSVPQGGLEKADGELLYRVHTSSCWKMRGRAAL